MTEDFLLKAFHLLPVMTLPQLGFKTRVGLTNDSHIVPNYTTDYTIQASCYLPDGKISQFIDNLGILKPKEKKSFIVQDLFETTPESQLILFHLVPIRLAKLSKDGATVLMNQDEIKAEISTHVSLQGHQVEFVRDDGYSSGVLYSVGPLNYKKFYSGKRTTLIQAPKLYFSNCVNSFVTLINFSPDPQHKEEFFVKCAVTDPDGQVKAQWFEHVKPFTSIVVDIGSKLSEDVRSDQLKLMCLSCYCDEGVILPLVFNHNNLSQTLSIEHTYPPMGYSSSFAGKLRDKANQLFSESRLFKGIQR